MNRRTAASQLLGHVRVRIPVAIVLNNFDAGGTERQMTELMCRLDQTRFDLHVVCFRRDGQWLPRVEAATSSITCFPLTGFRSPSAWREVIRFARWCRAHRIEVVHACDFYANVFALPGAELARVPLRIGSRRDVIIPQRSAGQRRLQAMSYRCAHTVVANSRAAADQIVREGISRSRVAIIRNGIDISRYVPLPPGTPRRTITTVANLRPEKGHDVLIQAVPFVVRERPDTVFQLVGDGSARRALEALAGSLGVSEHVRFLGHRDDVPELLCGSDVFVLPSRTEAFPNAVLEAMAARLPIIATDVGGIPELIDNGRNGVLVPPGDERVLAAAILDLLRDERHAAGLALAARETVVSHSSFDHMVREFEALYSQQRAPSPVMDLQGQGPANGALDATAS